MTSTSTYELGPGGTPMTVTVQMSGRFGKVNILRVYHRVDAGPDEVEAAETEAPLPAEEER